MAKKDKLLLTFLGFLVVVAFIGGQIWNSNRNFTKEKWVEYQGNSRQFIVKNFLDRTIVEGLTEEEVIGYLGEAEGKTDQHLIYYLGKPKGFFGDQRGEEEALVFTFQEGKVVSATKMPLSSVE